MHLLEVPGGEAEPGAWVETRPCYALEALNLHPVPPSQLHHCGKRLCPWMFAKARISVHL